MASNLTRQEANILQANVEGLNPPFETTGESMHRLYVFLYLKMKNDPKLNDDFLKNAHTQPNDPTPYKLSDTQLNELLNSIELVNSKNTPEISNSVFHTQIDELNRQLRLWEKPGTVIYYGLYSKIANSPAGFIDRAMPTLINKKRNYTFNTNNFWARNLEPKTNAKNLKKNVIGVFKSIEKFLHYTNNEIFDSKNMYMVINYARLQAYVPIKSEELTKISFVKDAFSEGKISLMSPKLGFIIQKIYPYLWLKKLWPGYKNDLDKIAFLTLQKYAALRRFYFSNDDSLSAELYTTKPSIVHLEVESDSAINNSNYNKMYNTEFVTELIQNQMWVLSTSEEDYRQRVETNNLEGVKFNNLRELKKYFLGVFTKPKGFKTSEWNNFEESFPVPPMKNNSVLKYRGTLNNTNNRRTSKKKNRKTRKTRKN
jgi:hypothetical protein